MALIDVPGETGVTGDAKKLRRRARHIALTVHGEMKAIVAIAQVHGKAALATELGADAATFTLLYNDARAFVENYYNAGLSDIPTVANLPA